MDLEAGKARTLLVERSDVWINLHHLLHVLDRPIHPKECRNSSFLPPLQVAWGVLSSQFFLLLPYIEAYSDFGRGPRDGRGPLGGRGRGGVGTGVGARVGIAAAGIA